MALTYMATPRMTSNSAPSPYVASASTEFSASFAAWRAFSGNQGGSYDWFANTSTGILKFDHGSALSIVGYALVAPRTVGVTAAPNTWAFDGSDNDSTWTELDAQSSKTFTVGVMQYYTFTEATYRYYRIDVSANNGDTLLGIGELYFLIQLPSGGGGGLKLVGAGGLVG